MSLRRLLGLGPDEPPEHVQAARDAVVKADDAVKQAKRSTRLYWRLRAANDETTAILDDYAAGERRRVKK